MSKANREGKEFARQRVAQMKLEQAAAAKRRRRNTVFGSVFGVIIIAVLIGVVVSNSLKPTTPTVFPAAAVADTSGGVASANGMSLPIGNANAPVKMTVYEDFRCSACEAFETNFQASYKQLVAAGTVELLIHPVDLIDNNQPGTDGSLQAGNAAGCAQDAGKFQAFHDELYANQPSESTDSFGTAAAMISWGKKVPGLDSPTFEACVNSGKYDDWVKQNYQNLTSIDAAGPSTPTILLNGKPYTLPALSTAAASAAQFITDVDKLAGVNPIAAPTASSTATTAPTTAPATTTPATTAPASATPTATKS